MSLRKGQMGVSVEWMTELCEIKEAAKILAKTVIKEHPDIGGPSTSPTRKLLEEYQCVSLAKKLLELL